MWLIGLTLGLAGGSFVNALVWRLHEQSNTKSASTPDHKLSILSGRSMCPYCRHALAWYDLLPVISWLSLLGRCRHCKKPISIQYPLIELATALLFIGSVLVIDPHSGSQFVELGFWWVATVLLVALALYDLRWLILPNRLVYLLLGWTIVYLAVRAIINQSAAELLDSLAGACLVGGLFYLLFGASKGRWLGGGDVKLAAFIGLALGWQRALIALTLASWLGLAAYGLLAAARRPVRQRQLPFGPYLIVATFLSYALGDWLIDHYLQLAGLR